MKNFEGDFYFEQEKFYRLPKSEMVNPLNQLSRCETLLRQLLQEHGLLIPIVGNVVFINPEFSLFQAPLNKPLILPTQLNRYWKKLNTISSKLVKKQRLIAEKLVSLHMIESPYKQLPSYSYDLLRKGICCVSCASFSIIVVGKKCVCKNCGHQEMVSMAVMRSVEEFRILFPDDRLTTNIIHDWCRVIGSKKRIRRILDKNFDKVGGHRWVYFK